MPETPTIPQSAGAVLVAANGAALALTGVRTEVDVHPGAITVESTATFVNDLAAGNPPYFSHFKIAELFVASAHEALKPGGKALFVTKHPEWFEENMTPRFAKIATRPVRDYVVVSGIKAR